MSRRMLRRINIRLRRLRYRHGRHLLIAAAAVAVVASALSTDATPDKRGENLRPRVCAGTRDIVRRFDPPPAQRSLMLRDGCASEPLYAVPVPGSQAGMSTWLVSHAVMLGMSTSIAPA